MTDSRTEELHEHVRALRRMQGGLRNHAEDVRHLGRPKAAGSLDAAIQHLTDAITQLDHHAATDTQEG